jgi:hypothetical protein
VQSEAGVISNEPAGSFSAPFPSPNLRIDRRREIRSDWVKQVEQLMLRPAVAADRGDSRAILNRGIVISLLRLSLQDVSLNLATDDRSARKAVVANHLSVGERWESTSRSPDDIPAFNKKIIMLFGEARRRRHAA